MSASTHTACFFRVGLGLGLLSAAQNNGTTDNSLQQDNKPRGRVIVINCFSMTCIDTDEISTVFHLGS